MSNFIVSARKYRPATFNSVVGQNHITSTLMNAISRNQLAHAYLFCGPRGVGKTTCARIFAKTINCLSLVEGESCGECESCVSFEQGRSFNIHELDAASNNSVDDIRSLTEQVRIPPQIGRYSVYIIDEVHMLSAAAFNAFLKTLEEPPAHAVFILATTEKHKIIPTILSRCQIFDFNRIRVEDGVEYLKYIAKQEGVTYDDESLHLIAQKADGGMRDALSMFDKAVSFGGNDLNFKSVATTLNILDYDTYFNITSLILAGDYPATLTLFDEILRKGFSCRIFITGLNAHLRDILMSKDAKTAGLLEVTGSLLERYKEQAKECEVGFLFESIALLTNLDGTLRTASNQRLNVELGLMKLCGLSQKKKEHQPIADKEDNVSSELAARVDGVGNAKLPPLRKKGGDAQSAQQDSGVNKESREQDTSHTPPTDKQPVNLQDQPKSDAKIANAESSSTTKEPSREISETLPPSSKPEESTTSSKSSNTPIKKEMSDVGTPTISGRTIGSLLKSMNQNGNGEVDENGVEMEAGVMIDPESEEKIKAKRDSFIRNLHSDRPRIAMAFQNMRIKGNTIHVDVPSETLYEEILRNRGEILTLLSEICEIDGVIKLEIEIKEDKSALKPIKIEDRLKFLTEKNPTLTLLRQQLDLDIE